MVCYFWFFIKQVTFSHKIVINSQSFFDSFAVIHTEEDLAKILGFFYIHKHTHTVQDESYISISNDDFDNDRNLYKNPI